MLSFNSASLFVTFESLYFFLLEIFKMSLSNFSFFERTLIIFNFMSAFPCSLIFILNRLFRFSGDRHPSFGDRTRKIPCVQSWKLIGISRQILQSRFRVLKSYNKINKVLVFILPLPSFLIAFFKISFSFGKYTNSLREN